MKTQITRSRSVAIMVALFLLVSCNLFAQDFQIGA